MPLILLALLFSAAKPAWTVLPVYDAASTQHQLQQLAQMAEQLQQLRATLQQAQALTRQAKQHYEAVTGCRNLGELLHQRTLYEALPAHWQQFYEHSTAISRTIQDILSRERLAGEVKDLLPLITQRQQDTVAAHMAFNAQAYEIADQRIAQLERLMRQIDQAKDAKAISDLQARIHIEQALIQNDSTKLQLAHQLQRNQLALLAQQRQRLSQRILSAGNTGMPQLKVYQP